MENSIPKINVGIAAFNAEKNIGPMLESLLSQREDGGFSISEIIVHCDNCTDKTADIVKSFQNPKIKIIDSKQRKGFAGSVKVLLGASNGDITVLLNDDIKIEDSNFIKKLILPFQLEPEVGLVCGNMRPLPPKTFVERAINSSFWAYEAARAGANKGNNVFTVDGKILAVSNVLKQSLRFPEDLKKMGNTDTYLYFSCLEAGLKYRFASQALVLYRPPATLKEYIKATTRNNIDQYLLVKKFGQKVTDSFRFPTWLLWKYKFLEFLKNPLGALFIFFTGFYIRARAKSQTGNFNAKWEVIATSKNLE